MASKKLLKTIGLFDMRDKDSLKKITKEVFTIKNSEELNEAGIFLFPIQDTRIIAIRNGEEVSPISGNFSLSASEIRDGANLDSMILSKFQEAKLAIKSIAKKAKFLRKENEISYYQL